jgi:hypothetical protein
MEPSFRRLAWTQDPYAIDARATDTPTRARLRSTESRTVTEKMKAWMQSATALKRLLLQYPLERFQVLHHPGRVVGEGAFAGLDANAYTTKGGRATESLPSCSAEIGRSCVANATDSTTTTTLPLDSSAIGAMAPYKSSLILPYAAAEVPNSVPHLAGPGHI